MGFHFSVQTTWLWYNSNHCQQCSDSRIFISVDEEPAHKNGNFFDHIPAMVVIDDYVHIKFESFSNGYSGRYKKAAGFQ